ncbi:unnamed protein product [Trypanosoma congolense IL3000]|uniref:WGS project CAEQ00000000 data, annotated contig 108 n=1 Tax=Trypanosoma congolense (strain IL3000) TaxID=1068625 RepID=F9W3P8_TRYCI|nr:unnamed protein product [Trypanosoma congolense IL3000]
MTADRGAADEAGKTTDAVTNNNGNNDKSENNDGAERCRNISGSEGEIPDGQDGRVVPVHGSAEDSLALGQTQASGAQGQGTYSAEQLINQEIPLTTAYPERRIVHPGNHEERIPPTGGSEYNGTVTEPWKEPKSEANTYLRLMPTYESTTHYQLRTGRYYTEDQAPPHGMKLPLKTSLFKREW